MKIFLFSFKMAIKTAGPAQKIRVGRVSENRLFSALKQSCNEVLVHYFAFAQVYYFSFYFYFIFFYFFFRSWLNRCVISSINK